MTVASIITLCRIALIPLYMVLMACDYVIPALVVFVIASITDTVDGYVARKYNQVSDFGKFIDPLADKLLVFSALLIFVEWGIMPSWIAMIILARELMVTSLRIVAMGAGFAMAARLSGKIKTTVQIICIVGIMLFTNAVLWDIPVYTFFNYALLIVTVWSGIDYVVSNLDLFKDTTKNTK